MTIHECRPTDANFLVDAPERHVLGIELACTPEQLFTILEDPDSWPRWAPGILGVEWTSPRPYGVGTTRTVSLRGGPKIDERFDVWEPGRVMAFHVDRATEPVFHAFAERYAIEPLAGDRCRLTWTVAYTPQGGFAKVHPWVRPAMHATLRVFTWLLRREVARQKRGAFATA